ncbi:MAG: ABC transporter permease, partial [Muribaculaceae bacterium]|nr:ABC transporter permease [Muribaculaceae bacterium]
MDYSIFIASRLKLAGDARQGTPSLKVAMAGIVLAIVVMILSLAVVMGFKQEISGKVYQLDAHLKVANAAIGIDDNYSTVNAQPIYKAVAEQPAFAQRVASMSLIADQPAILKTDTDFEGIVYRGVDDGYDWSYLQSNLVEVRVPCITDTADVNEVLISRELAQKLRLKVGDHVYTYFIMQKVKVRNALIVGIV